MIAPLSSQSLIVYCGQRMMTARLGRLCIPQSAREISSVSHCQRKCEWLRSTHLCAIRRDLRVFPGIDLKGVMSYVSSRPRLKGYLQ